MPSVFVNRHPYLVVQTVKDLPAMWEPWIRSLGWEDPMEKEMQATPVFLPGEFHGQRSLAGYSPWSRKDLDMTEQLILSLSLSSSMPGRVQFLKGNIPKN